MHETIEALIAENTASNYAIGAEQLDWMDYTALRKLSQETRQKLRNLGISQSDRLAIILPNGPIMASAFITLAQAATTAPLNPNYTKNEFLFYLEDLQAKAIIVLAEDDNAATKAAISLNIPIIRLIPVGCAGMFDIQGDQIATISEDKPTKPNDIALILHTSGTTSRPKIVPLTQRNVAASAQNVAASLQLSADDRCLNVMPLFHIHGLIAAVLGSLAASGSIFCSNGFNALNFFSNLQLAQPSWYSAVPTMHQAILARAKNNQDIIAQTPLRFLRSSSASLPALVMAELQQTFNAPVIEAYGMTEAAHQMCCNPLYQQKSNSVGIAAGPKVAIADETRNQLINDIGEVVITGDNVTLGYENNAKANKDNFFDLDGERWFRTGDQGRLDQDGFLHLTGRLKEIINRGGEKISPLEIDELLMRHPAIAQVVTFALPHAKLGEEVAAAVVLHADTDTDETAIKDFARNHITAFKVPRHVVIMDEIPKGATGKMQRIGMAEKLGLL